MDGKPEPLKLNLGCGRDIRKGFVNIDIRPLPGAIVGNVQRPDYPRGAVDYILAKDVLEHLGIKGSLEALRNWADILKPGGILRIQTPSVERVFKKYYSRALTGEIPWERLSYIIYGGQDYSANYHSVLYSFEWLKRELSAAGMIRIRKYRRDRNQNMFVESTKT